MSIVITSRREKIDLRCTNICRFKNKFNYVKWINGIRMNLIKMGLSGDVCFIHLCHGCFISNGKYAHKKDFVAYKVKGIFSNVLLMRMEHQNMTRNKITFISF